MEQKTKEGYFKVAPEIRERLLKGKFPDQVREQFQQMIEYFGQSPIIVRSSSLLEDAFGNAFAGKYESLFCTNQGSPEQRLAQFENAVREVYASTMGDDALVYRLQRGLDQQDEQMALLVQRVSGSYRDNYFFPDLAGVALSYNTFVWNPDLDPKAGMVRLVLGLGTRAVGRVEDDYPQTIALDAPLLRPLADMEDVRRFSQHYVDLLDIQNNCLTSVPIQELLSKKIDLKIDLVASPDHEMSEKAKSLRMPQKEYWLVTFEKLLKETDFVSCMQKILKRLETSYHYPVDVEFTVNFTKEDKLMINLLQCRPLQTKGRRAAVSIPTDIKAEKLLFLCHGYFMGGSISADIKRVIFVDPKQYEAVPLQQKYDIARAIGALNKQITNKDDTGLLMFGPGRWGTTTPSLGVPVSFSEINNVTVLGELACEGTNLVPDLSFGTHFFQDLVETDIFYVAIFPSHKGFAFNEKWFAAQPNQLASLLPDKAKYADRAQTRPRCGQQEGRADHRTAGRGCAAARRVGQRGSEGRAGRGFDKWQTRGGWVPAGAAGRGGEAPLAGGVRGPHPRRGMGSHLSSPSVSHRLAQRGAWARLGQAGATEPDRALYPQCGGPDGIDAHRIWRAGAPVTHDLGS